MRYKSFWNRLSGAFLIAATAGLFTIVSAWADGGDNFPPASSDNGRVSHAGVLKKETVSSGDFIDDVPIRPMAAGDPIKVSNTSFEVSLTSDRYVYFSDFQIVYLWATVKNLGGTTDRFDFVLTSDAPEGWSDVKENAGFIHLGPGEQGDLKYMWSTVYARATREVEASFTYKVTSEQHGGSESFTVTVIAYPQISEGGYTDGSARVTGTITDAATGGPVSDAEVMLWLGYTIRIMPYDMLKVSDSQGAYEVGCWDIDTLNTHYGSYFTIPGYALIVQKAGYETYVHKQYVLPRNGSPTTLNISLTPLANPPDYTLAWETPLASPGVWEIAVTDAWDRFAVAMGKHPDPDDLELLPATIPFIDNQGNILWSKSLADESWAVDVTSDGKYVACATNSLGGNNFYYLWDAEGNEVWKKSIPSESIEIKFSPDNKYIATGPSEDGTRFVLYGSPGGSEQWKYNMDDKSVRAASFTDDGQYVFAGGLPHRFTIGGDLNWRNFIAYTPYVICSSEDKSRVMAADKGDCLSMFDGDGKLLWRKEQKVITYGAMSADGKVVVILTTHGYVYCYNGEGELQWCSYLRGKGTSLTAGVGGHNAVDVTPDGKYIVVGGTNYSTVLYDSDGNVLWRHMGSATYIPGLVGGGLKQSVMAVRISDDARKIVSGYGTSDPRLCYFTATTFVPDPEIKANGEDGPITVSSGAQVAVTVSLNPGNHASQNADWWLLESTPKGTLNYLVLSSGSLVQGLLPTYQGPLFTLGSTQVLNLSGLTSGTHIFYFGVDLNMNGSLDTGSLYYDSVRVNVTGP